MTEEATRQDGPDTFRQSITDNLDALLSALPPQIVDTLKKQADLFDLVEVVIDLGRQPRARFPQREVVLSETEIEERDIEYVVARIGAFGGDNRAGIERTLHRISAIRNRKGKVVGLTCRVGRAVFGTIKIIEDLVQSGKSVLLLGKPGVGKTTMLREVARVLADDFKKRVVVVDTSNEIAGDGDIPHPGIGSARRMQVPTPTLQHEVMIEAVENHMPEVIIIDEIGRELEAQAARTIAERGVQLIATAHGNTLDNLIVNPTLADLIGGIQTVTLGDEEARRRGTQKSILERKSPPTFDVAVEIQDRHRVAVHPNVAETVDEILRGNVAPPETRSLDEHGKVVTEQNKASSQTHHATHEQSQAGSFSANGAIKVFPFGVNRGRLDQTIRGLRLPVRLVSNMQEAEVLITTKAYYRDRPKTIHEAENTGITVYVLRKNSVPQIEQCLVTICETKGAGQPLDQAIKEAQSAAEKVLDGEDEIQLTPQGSYIRRLQHQIAERYKLMSSSVGREPFRRVRIFRSGEASLEE